MLIHKLSFSGGYLIWRGHFNASGDETGFALTVQGGFAFGFSAWFNGVFLGSSQGNSSVSQTSVTWSIPEGSLAMGKDNVLVVLQGQSIPTHIFIVINSHHHKDHMGLVETSCELIRYMHGPITDTSFLKANGGKEPRGIRGYSIIGGSTTFSEWKLAGHLVSRMKYGPRKYRYLMMWI